MLFPKNFDCSFENAKDTIADISENANEIAGRIKNFIINNPHATVAILSAGASLIRAMRSYNISSRITKETRRMDYKWYDPHTGLRWDLKRKLTNADRYEITRRQSNGEHAYDILKSIRAI